MKNIKVISSRISRDPIWALIVLGMIFLGWALAWLYAKYAARYFAFHDLTIIVDWFSNGFYRGHPFWVSELSLNHLSIHWTPSLAPLILLVGPFPSQFSFIAWTTLAVTLALVIWARFHAAWLRGVGISPGLATIAAIVYFLVIARNQYTLRILDSASFPPWFLLATALLAVTLIRSRSWAVLLVALGFALGIRQDAGLFLFFFLFGFYLVPRACVSDKKKLFKKIMALQGLCIIYVVLATLIVLPAFGYELGIRYWDDWGISWPDVFLGYITSPHRVWLFVMESAFRDFNGEFLWLPLLSHVFWLAGQLPGVLFYTANIIALTQLMHYNSSFLLPSLLLSLTIGFAHAIQVVGWIGRKWRYGRHLTSITFVALCLLFLVIPIKNLADKTYQFSLWQRTDPFADVAVKQLLECDDIQSVASDFETIVFVPNRFERYMLEHLQKADLVVLETAPNLNLFLAKAATREEVRERVIDSKGYRLAITKHGFEVFIRSDICLE